MILFHILFMFSILEMRCCGSRPDKLHAHANWAHLRASSLRGMPKFFVREEKILDSQIINRVDKSVKT